MGKSFFRGTDAEVYTGSNAFSAMINESPEEFGISPELAEQYASANAIYAAAYLAANDPHQRTSGRVAAKTAAKARLKLLASNLASIIDGSGASDEQKINLGLSVRKQPEPLPPPGAPSHFKVVLLGNGSWKLGWKSNNPPSSRGTMYEIRRRVLGETDYKNLGVTGKRWYIDEHVPQGASAVTYRVQAVRSESVGAIGEYTVNIGSTRGLRLQAAA